MLNTEIIACRKCPRLVQWREEIARTKRKAFRNLDYWGKPVPGFGDKRAKVLVVGLAPGAHGSNRTGRQFTGDGSGEFLYAALYRAGFASQPRAESRADGLTLRDMYITASVRCAPPANKPSLQELNNCQPYLEKEIELLKPRVIVCLGRIAFERIIHIYFARNPGYQFGHGLSYELDDGTWILCSYHPSQQNTFTGKLTREMFDAVWVRAKELIHE
jgi:uracil-DNA glycosylase family 4